MREFAIQLARQAGRLLLDYRRRGLAREQIRTKSNHVDLVTDADLASERLISEAIRSRFPGHCIYGEETAGASLPEAEWLWLVDPLDGTTNFAHGVPLYVVNIALAHQGTLVLGVTHDPSSGRTYWAERGGGAWLRVRTRDQRLRVSSTDSLGRCLLATGFPPSRLTNPDNNLAEFAALEMQVHAVRRVGSAALELAWVAAGLLDGYWEPWLNPWDWAAGVLLVREAGGQVTDYGGHPWELSSRTLISSNGCPAVHTALVEAIAAARASLRPSAPQERDLSSRWDA